MSKIEKTRQLLRDKKIMQRRQNAKEAAGQKEEKMEQIESKPLNEEEHINDAEAAIRVIDLAELIKSEENIAEDNYQVDYFILQRHGNRYIDPTNFSQCQQVFEQHLDSNDREAHLDDDFDSQDSNREDHENNEYPEEQEGDSQEGDEWSDHENYNNDDDYNSEGHHDNQMSDEDDYRKPQRKQIKNSIFEKILKKNRDWSYQNHMAQFKDTGYLDDYE